MSSAGEKRMTPGNTVGGLAALVGLMFGPLLLVLGSRDLEGALSARTWTPALATVTSSEVVTAGVARGRSIHADVRYAYSFNDLSYENDRVRSGLFLTRRSADRLVGQYDVGDSVRVYVDPEKPSRSVLQQGGTGVGVAEIGAGLLFLSMWIAAIVRERRARRANAAL